MIRVQLLPLSIVDDPVPITPSFLNFFPYFVEFGRFTLINQLIIFQLQVYYPKCL